MIHPTAIVDPRAEIDPTAEIGAYAVIEGPARIGVRTRVMARAVVTGGAALGADNVVHYGAVLGDVPQDLAFAGAESFLRIGDGNVFREHSTVHRGTRPGSATVIGNRNYFMQNSHVAHNCAIGDDAIVAGGALLSGYVELGDRGFVSGNCVVHQFVRIGRLALLRGLSRTSRDVPPFCIMDGTHTVRAVNRVGLHRAGFSAEALRALRNAFKALFLRPRNLRQALAEVEAEPMTAEVKELVDFIRASKRGVCFGPRADGPDAEAG
ncbi:MAG: acyl-ACP--UDP-N-acetylglucosamine O-acyltransferase [Deltaproteobacteria bacterium]|nr:acyl-ACP--UDP-N-acetylglucosamine O-acyltransferase [Deltaproteobacteria bacterium]